jgi:lipopolysaccharide transport system ATP-binding protein
MIKVEHISKQYTIGVDRTYKTFQDTITNTIKSPLSLFKKSTKEDNTFWALKDVSFEIEEGEVVGIIGRNGAGKSTLLKILSRITEPTEGKITMHGRVASLLEVGTGFHPELTGRENIYLNGSILGMKKREIDTKFDEIVKFAEIEKFLDTPVKRYSSGMYVRLAFAVATHLEPEILIIDEVLAVGDAAFQKKCLGKMGEVAKEGRTVLFVSHQMNAIKSLCSRCLLLSRGNLIDDGNSQKIIKKYLHEDGEQKTQWIFDFGKSQISNPYFNLLKLSLIDINRENISGSIRADEIFGILIEGETEIINNSLTLGFRLYNSSGDLFFRSLHTDKHPDHWPGIKKGLNKLIAWIPENYLNEGDYIIEFDCSLHNQEWLYRPTINAPSINFSIRGRFSDSPHCILDRPGLLAPLIDFEKY